MLAGLGIVVITWAVPPAPREEQPEPPCHGDVLFNPQPLRLNIGVFVLHVCQTALFVVVPTLLVDRLRCRHRATGWFYLPVIVVLFLLMVPPMIIAERRGRLREVFLGAIAPLIVAMLAAPVLTYGTGRTGDFPDAVFHRLQPARWAIQPAGVPPGAAPGKGFCNGVYK